MFHKGLFPHFRHEFLDEAGIPELGGDAEVFAAAHEGVGFAAFGGGGDAVWVEVLLFAAGYGDESVTLRWFDMVQEVKRLGIMIEGDC